MIEGSEGSESGEVRQEGSSEEIAAGLVVTEAVAEVVISAPAEAEAQHQAERATAAVESAAAEAAPAEHVEAPAVEQPAAPARRSVMPEVEVAQFDASLSPFERQVKAAAQAETPAAIAAEAPAAEPAPAAPAPVVEAPTVAPMEAPKAAEPVVEAPVAAAPASVETPVETAAPEIVAAPVAAEPTPAAAPAATAASTEKPSLPMASTGRAANDPREVRRRRLEAERLQKQAEAAATSSTEAPAPVAAEVTVEPAASSPVTHEPAKAVVTENGEELDESKAPKSL